VTHPEFVAVIINIAIVIGVLARALSLAALLQSWFVSISICGSTMSGPIFNSGSYRYLLLSEKGKLCETSLPVGVLNSKFSSSTQLFSSFDGRKIVMGRTLRIECTSLFHSSRSGNQSEFEVSLPRFFFTLASATVTCTVY
jgi:hypothetical protein